jgi:hypothetical protein
MRASLTILFVLTFSIATGQRYTYLGGGIGIISSKFQLNENLSIRSPTIITGGSYDVYLRQDLTDFLAFELGYSWRNYASEYMLPGNSFAYPSVGLWSHLIPINIDIRVDVLKDRISLYASFGYLISVKQYAGSGSIKSFNHKGDSILVQWDYIAESDHSSHFTIGLGTRVRVFDELRFEVELGYAFGFKDQRKYEFTYWDQYGAPQVQNTTYKGEYWYLKIGLSYPIQRMIVIAKSGISKLK